MSPTDELVQRLRTDLRLLGNALAANDEERRAAAAYAAMMGLRRAFSDECQAELDRKDLARLQALRSTV